MAPVEPHSKVLDAIRATEDPDLTEEEARELSSETNPSPQRLLEYASKGDWEYVAFHLALRKDLLHNRLSKRDEEVLKRLKSAMGVVEVRLPREFAAGASKPGRGCGTAGKYASALGAKGLAAEILVEQPRWMLPRPRPDDCFLLSHDGTKKLDEGWYVVAQHPVSDDLREAVLWRQQSASKQMEAARILREEGETLLCKAVKAGQWELVDWLFHQEIDGLDRVELAEQVQFEFGCAFKDIERRARVQTWDDIDELCKCLALPEVVEDACEKTSLKTPWRHGLLKVPKGSKLKQPAVSKLDSFRRATAEIRRKRTHHEELTPKESSALQVFLSDCPLFTFTVPAAGDVEKRWLSCLAAVGRPTFGMPLLHQSILSGVSREHHDVTWDVTKRLVDAGVPLDVCDSDGLTALGVTANARTWRTKERQWDTFDLLLNAWSPADGRSGALLKATLVRASRPKVVGGEDEAAKASEVLEKIEKQKDRAPMATLTDFFRSQAQGNVVLGREPRRYKRNAEGALESRDGRRVWSLAVIVERNADAIYFLECTGDDTTYDDVVSGIDLDLKEKRLVPEGCLRAAQSVAVALPSTQVGPPDRDGAVHVKPAPGPLAARRPVTAKVPPTRKLRVLSHTACCSHAIPRLEVFVNRTAVGETDTVPGMDVCEMAQRGLPKKDLELNFAFSGNKLLKEPGILAPDTDEEHEEIVEVPLAIYIYTTSVEGEDGITEDCLVWVCGHKADLPEDKELGAPFAGTVSWAGGSTRVAAPHPALQIPVVVAGADCREQMKSLRFAPDLKPGFAFEAKEWPETEDCQFFRILRVPVTVGMIKKL